jgi:hypothetical protein
MWICVKNVFDKAYPFPSLCLTQSKDAWHAEISKDEVIE